MTVIGTPISGSPITGVLADVIIDLRRMVKDVDAGVPSELLWSDQDWLEYLASGEREICERAHVLEDSTTAAVCTITLVEGTSSYSLNPVILFIEQVVPSYDTANPIPKRTEEWLDKNYAGWRDLEDGTIEYVVEKQTNKLVVVPPIDVVAARVTGSNGSYYRCILNHTSSAATKPVTGASWATYWVLDATSTTGAWADATVYYATKTLNLTVKRRPLLALSESNTTPEIGSYLFDDLKNWALFKAYSKRDAEIYDEQKSNYYAKFYYALFESRVGLRPDANIQRIMKQETVTGVQIQPYRR